MIGGHGGCGFDGLKASGLSFLGYTVPLKGTAESNQVQQNDNELGQRAQNIVVKGKSSESEHTAAGQSYLWTPVENRERF